eukprot:COSAG02_NODE_5914_length_3942_cov_1.908665_3_plen_278_part_00
MACGSRPLLLVCSLPRFFAPWCGHCKELKPNYLELAKDYGLHEKVFVATVDCTESRPTCVDNGIEGYPTLKYWIGGEPGKKVFGFPTTDEGVYTDWHGAGKESGFGKLKKFVLEVLGEGVEPPPRAEEPPPPPPAEEVPVEKRPKGWWKNPEKWVKPTPKGESTMPNRPQPAARNLDGTMKTPEQIKEFEDRVAAESRDADDEEPEKKPSVLMGWDVAKVSQWLADNKVDASIIETAKEEGVDGPMLAVMDKSDWKELGVSGLKATKLIAKAKHISA